jgi:ABC-type glycerol-3-phosphate transport system substrate-binding protein
MITPDEFKKVYYPVVQRDMTKNGAIYGLPQGMDTLALFINKDIFSAAQAKVPQTWDEFITTAKSLTVKDENGIIKTAGAALGSYDNVTHAPDIISLLLVTNGVDLNAIDNQQGPIKMTIPYYVSFASGADSVWDDTMGASRDMFASGSLAMYIGYSWDIFAIKAANKDFQFNVYPVPYLPKEGSASKITIASYWANGVSKKSKNQKDALLFLKYLADKDVVQQIYTESSKTRLFGMPYARRDLAATLSDNPLIYPFVQQAEYATSSYFASDTGDSLYNDPLNTYLGNAVRGVHANMSPDTATNTLIQGINQARTQSLQ